MRETFFIRLLESEYPSFKMILGSALPAAYEAWVDNMRSQAWQRDLQGYTPTEVTVTLAEFERFCMTATFTPSFDVLYACAVHLHRRATEASA